MWHGFLAALAAQTDSSQTALIFRPIDGYEIMEFTHGGDLGKLMRNLMIAPRDKATNLTGEMREGRVYTLDELKELRGDIESPPAPVRKFFMRSVRISGSGGVEAWLTLGHHRDFKAADGALLANLVPHVRIALRSFIALERERFHSSVASTAFSRMNFGWLTLDARCHIVDVSPNMEQLFQRTGILRRGRYNRLMPASPAVDREISALMKEIASNPHRPPKAIHLSRDPWMDMLIAPAQRPVISGGAPPVAIAYVSGDRQSQADRCDQLVELFGLLPSEARLAWQLAQGTSIAEAASMTGVTEETARNYSKKIYAKTGARRQPELVRIILTSVLAIA